MMNIFDRLLSGETVPFDDSGHKTISEACDATRAKLIDINTDTDPKSVHQKLGALFAHPLSEHTRIVTPILVNYGGNVHIGERVFINYGCSMLDLGGIHIGDDVMIGPQVTIVSEEHPTAPDERKQLFCRPVHIHNGVWIGAGVTIIAGVTIGEHSVVAAGSVVTKDVPPRSIVAGVPAKVIKPLP